MSDPAVCVLFYASCLRLVNLLRWHRSPDSVIHREHMIILDYFTVYVFTLELINRLD